MSRDLSKIVFLSFGMILSSTILIVFRKHSHPWLDSSLSFKKYIFVAHKELESNIPFKPKDLYNEI